MSHSPIVSVVMPIFNGECYLRQAIASIRWQTFTDWELICIDDGSTDSTAGILEKFAAADSRIHIVRQANQGIVAARNKGLQHAKAPWIACLDCDDLAMPERLATQLQFVRENPEVIVVGSNIMCIDSEGLPIRTARYATEHEDIERSLLHGSNDSIANPSVLMSRKAVMQVGLYRSEYETVEDMDLWLRLAQIGPLANISQELTYYRLHEQMCSWKHHELQRERLLALLKEAHEIRGISPSDAIRKWEKKPRKQTSASGKWARHAVRSRHYRTALKHWHKQMKDEPWSLLSFRISAEMVARGTLSVLGGRSTPLRQLPDWRHWDASADVSSTQQCQVV